MPTLFGKSVNDVWGGTTWGGLQETDQGEARPGEAMVHDETTYMDDEGMEYVELGGQDEESGYIVPVRVTTGGRLWGADEAYGGYDAE